jgi:hypothetical protein
MPHIPVNPGHGIDSTFIPRVTAQDTLRRHRRTARRAMHSASTAYSLQLGQNRQFAPMNGRMVH